ncbi:MAG: hypothetical protein LBV34_22700, partial [Nocardiopsaceae bacterium]|nr:hypothetical protein [Nocardiopsaceae bacterium]
MRSRPRLFVPIASGPAPARRAHSTVGDELLALGLRLRQDTPLDQDGVLQVLAELAGAPNTEYPRNAAALVEHAYGRQNGGQRVEVLTVARLRLAVYLLDRDGQEAWNGDVLGQFEAADPVLRAQAWRNAEETWIRNVVGSVPGDLLSDELREFDAALAEVVAHRHGPDDLMNDIAEERGEIAGLQLRYEQLRATFPNPGDLPPVERVFGVELLAQRVLLPEPPADGTDSEDLVPERGVPLTIVPGFPLIERTLDGSGRFRMKTAADPAVGNSKTEGRHLVEYRFHDQPVRIQVVRRDLALVHTAKGVLPERTFPIQLEPGNFFDDETRDEVAVKSLVQQGRWHAENAGKSPELEGAASIVVPVVKDRHQRYFGTEKNTNKIMVTQEPRARQHDVLLVTMRSPEAGAGKADDTLVVGGLDAETGRPTWRRLWEWGRHGWATVMNALLEWQGEKVVDRRSPADGGTRQSRPGEWSWGGRWFGRRADAKEELRRWQHWYRDRGREIDELHGIQAQRSDPAVGVLLNAVTWLHTTLSGPFPVHPGWNLVGDVARAHRDATGAAARLGLTWTDPWADPDRAVPGLSAVASASRPAGGRRPLWTPAVSETVFRLEGRSGGTEWQRGKTSVGDTRPAGAGPLNMRDPQRWAVRLKMMNVQGSVDVPMAPLDLPISVPKVRGRDVHRASLRPGYLAEYLWTRVQQVVDKAGKNILVLSSTAGTKGNTWTEEIQLPVGWQFKSNTKTQHEKKNEMQRLIFAVCDQVQKGGTPVSDDSLVTLLTVVKRRDRPPGARFGRTDIVFRDGEDRPAVGKVVLAVATLTSDGDATVKIFRVDEETGVIGESVAFAGHPGKPSPAEISVSEGDLHDEVRRAEGLVIYRGPDLRFADQAIRELFAADQFGSSEISDDSSGQPGSSASKRGPEAEVEVGARKRMKPAPEAASVADARKWYHERRGLSAGISACLPSHGQKPEVQRLNRAWTDLGVLLLSGENDAAPDFASRVEAAHREAQESLSAAVRAIRLAGTGESSSPARGATAARNLPAGHDDPDAITPAPPRQHRNVHREEPHIVSEDESHAKAVGILRAKNYLGELAHWEVLGEAIGLVKGALRPDGEDNEDNEEKAGERERDAVRISELIGMGMDSLIVPVPLPSDAPFRTLADIWAEIVFLPEPSHNDRSWAETFVAETNAVQKLRSLPSWNDEGTLHDDFVKLIASRRGRLSSRDVRALAKAAGQVVGTVLPAESVGKKLRGAGPGWSAGAYPQQAQRGSEQLAAGNGDGSRRLTAVSGPRSRPGAAGPRPALPSREPSRSSKRAFSMREQVGGFFRHTRQTSEHRDIDAVRRQLGWRRARGLAAAIRFHRAELGPGAVAAVEPRTDEVGGTGIEGLLHVVERLRDAGKGASALLVDVHDTTQIWNIVTREAGIGGEQGRQVFLVNTDARVVVRFDEIDRERQRAAVSVLSLDGTKIGPDPAGGARRLQALGDPERRHVVWSAVDGAPLPRVLPVVKWANLVRLNPSLPALQTESVGPRAETGRGPAGLITQSTEDGSAGEAGRLPSGPRFAASGVKTENPSAVRPRVPPDRARSRAALEALGIKQVPVIAEPVVAMMVRHEPSVIDPRLSDDAQTFAASPVASPGGAEELDGRSMQTPSDLPGFEAPTRPARPAVAVQVTRTDEAATRALSLVRRWQAWA